MVFSCSRCAVGRCWQGTVSHLTGFAWVGEGKEGVMKTNQSSLGCKQEVT